MTEKHQETQERQSTRVGTRRGKEERRERVADWRGYRVKNGGDDGKGKAGDVRRDKC